MDTYSYVVNNPVLRFDPMGLAPRLELGGEELHKGLEGLFGSDICDWWPQICVESALICVEAVCERTDQCGHVEYYTVTSWLPDYPTPKEVPKVNKNCHCTKTQISAAQ